MAPKDILEPFSKELQNEGIRYVVVSHRDAVVRLCGLAGNIPTDKKGKYYHYLIEISNFS